MRQSLDHERIKNFMRELGRRLRLATVVYVTGGVSAVVEGWRESTIDLDLKFNPDDARP